MSSSDEDRIFEAGRKIRLFLEIFKATQNVRTSLRASFSDAGYIKTSADFGTGGAFMQRWEPS